MPGFNKEKTKFQNSDHLYTVLQGTVIIVPKTNTNILLVKINLFRAKANVVGQAKLKSTS